MPYTKTKEHEMAKRAAEPVVEEDTERDFTIYADKEPTGTMEAFADWLIDVVGLEFANSKLEAAFRDGVRLGGTLRMEFQASEYWREDERNPRSPAGKAARAAANGAAKEATAKPARGRTKPAADEDAEDEDVEEAPAKPARRARASAAKPATAKPAAATRRPAGRRGKPAAEPVGEGTAAPY